MDLRLFCLLVFAWPGFLKSQVLLQTTIVDTTSIVSGLDIPWEILWGPDNFIWATERYGRISRINPSTGEQHVLALVDEVYQESETGMLGMALHPDFPTEPYLFVVYTYLKNKEILEKLVRFTYSGGKLIQPKDILTGIPGNFNHTGSRLLFLPDKTLLLTTGDALNFAGSQDLNFLGGKVLRINPDGTIPGDNPFPGSPVWAYGLRNPQGLILHPNGKVYVSEHGPQTDDEINLIEKGRNYGWPNVTGFCNEPDEIQFCSQNNVKEPVLNWSPTIAPSGIAYYEHPAIPEFDGAILVAALKEKRLVSVKLAEDGESITKENHYFQNMFGRIRDVIQGPMGEVFIATNGPDPGNTEPFSHRIVRIQNAGYFKDLPGKVKVFPNPSNGSLKVFISAESSGMMLNLVDFTGSAISSKKVDGKNTIAEFYGLNPGFYFLQLITNGAIEDTVKLIVR